MNKTTHRKHPRQPVRHKRKSAWHLHRTPLLTAVLILLGLGVIGAAGGMAYSINLENQDTFCASCHTQPETTFVQQSNTSTAATLAAFHTQKGVRCIDCHSGPPPLGRLQGLSQGMQDLVAYYSGHYHNPAITTNKLGDGSCLKCHANAMADTSFNNHFHAFLSRWQAVDSNAAHCVDCHTSHLASIADQTYLVQATVEQVCQSCHQVLRGG